jgi:2-desacetyl-2-hydroxyethyl bacteriochlorophyllide A dehydrogenase
VKAVVITEPGGFEVTRLPDPAPSADGIVVAPEACGLCGTDLHIIDGEFPRTRYPIVPGHEFCGEVVAVGRDVSGVRVGDLVGVEPNITCGRCSFCRDGRSNLCDNWDAIGVGRADGGFAELAAVPAANAYVLPDGFPRRLGSLIEPLSCVVHGLDRLSLRSAEHVLIYGAGTMGLMLCQLIAQQAAASISVVDRNPARLGRAAAFGADFTATSAAELDRPGGWGAVIDATGAVAAIEDGITRVRRGGTFLLFGVAAAGAMARFSPFQIFNDEIRIIGSMAVLHSFERAALLLARGVVDGDALVTHTFELDRFAEAVETFRRGDGLKLQVGGQAARRAAAPWPAVASVTA